MRFLGLLVLGAVILYFAQGGLGKIAFAAIIISIGAYIIDEFIFSHIVFSYITKGGFALAIVIAVVRLVGGVFGISDD